MKAERIDEYNRQLTAFKEEVYQLDRQQSEIEKTISSTKIQINSEDDNIKKYMVEYLNLGNKPEMTSSQSPLLRYPLKESVSLDDNLVTAQLSNNFQI